MYRERFFAYYKISRFIFVLALAIAFQITGYFHVKSYLVYVLAAYGVVAFVRLFVKDLRGTFLDLLLDIVFISVVVQVTHNVYSFLNIFYLFPIFLGSVLLSQRLSVLLPCVAAGLYTASFFTTYTRIDSEEILNALLHLLSFLLIALAGTYLRDRLEKQEQYIRQLEEEKIVMQGYERLFRVSADFAHELRNPLASISAAVQFLEKGQTDKIFIDMLSTETRRLSALISDFLIFSRPSDAPKEAVDLVAVMKELAGHYEEKKKIIWQVAEVPCIQANRRLIEIAVNNLLKNAVEAAQSTVICTLAAGDGEHGAQFNDIVLQIEDDGPGIADSIKHTIFEPFFTTKKDGTGLGLAIAYRIISAYNGTIRIERSVLGGARFAIIFSNNVEKEH